MWAQELRKNRRNSLEYVYARACRAGFSTIGNNLIECNVAELEASMIVIESRPIPRTRSTQVKSARTTFLSSSTTNEYDT